MNFGIEVVYCNYSFSSKILLLKCWAWGMANDTELQNCASEPMPVYNQSFKTCFRFYLTRYNLRSKRTESLSTWWFLVWAQKLSRVGSG